MGRNFRQMRQDLGAGPEENLSRLDKQRVWYRRLSGRRSLVRIRRRDEAKSHGASDRAAQQKDGVTVDKNAFAVNQPLPTAQEA